MADELLGFADERLASCRVLRWRRMDALRGSQGWTVPARPPLHCGRSAASPQQSCANQKMKRLAIVNGEAIWLPSLQRLTPQPKALPNASCAPYGKVTPHMTVAEIASCLGVKRASVEYHVAGLPVAGFKLVKGKWARQWAFDSLSPKLQKRLAASAAAARACE